MSVSNDCREFRELVNRTRYGELSREERAALERHAEGCADCAVELRIHAHVTAVSGAELESAVPDEMVDTMWRNVMEDLSRRSVRRSPSGSRMWPMMKILVPALAAAVVVLVFTGGFLFGELRQLKTREQQLLSEMQRKDDLITELTVAQAGSGRSIYRTGEIMMRRGLPRQENFSAGELLSLLRNLAPETTILGTDETESLISLSLSWRGLSPDALPKEFDALDGLQAQEAIWLIEVLKIDPSETISRERLLALSKRRT